MKFWKNIFLVLAICLPSISAFAQSENETSGPIAEILVVGRAGTNLYTTETRHRLNSDDIANYNAGSAADILRRAPAAYIQTNSRGETLVFLRNAGERQIALFFDGALLNVPWDNRMDISLVPAPAINNITVASGVTSVEYGANTVGGAVNMTSEFYQGNGAEAEATIEYGMADLLRAQGALTAPVGQNGGVVLAVGHVEFGGLPLPNDATLSFGQTHPDLRTNTDSRMTNILAGYDISLADADFGLRFLYVDGEKGIAPEANKDPAGNPPRYWRYPDWKLWMVIVNGEWRPNSGTLLKGAVWLQGFDQVIESYTDVTYRTIDEVQDDENLTAGIRLTLSQEVGQGRLTGSFNSLFSGHDQRDIPYITGMAPPVLPAALEYSNRIISTGLGYQLPVDDQLTVKIEGSLDWMSAPKTGDKPSIDTFQTWNFTAGGQYDLQNGWRVRVAAGRKTRLPTMRELFGQALNRFLINPDLVAEASWLGEIGVGWAGDRGQFEIVPFISRTVDTIDQQNVTVNGNRLRQRVNLEGSRVLGVELTAAAYLTEEWTLSGHLTAMDVKRLRDNPADPVRLSEKPELIAQANLSYEGEKGLSGSLEIMHISGAYSLDDNDVFVALENSTEVNIRLGYDLGRYIGTENGLEIYVRANNIFDTVTEPQLGLIGAGRWVMGGISASF